MALNATSSWQAINNKAYSSNIPAVSKTDQQSYFTGTQLTGTYWQAPTLDVGAARRLILDFNISSPVSGNVVSVIPRMSRDGSEPSQATSGSWFAIGVSDGSFITGSSVSNVHFAQQKFFPLDIRLGGATADNNARRVSITLDVSDAKWCYLSIAEAAFPNSAPQITGSFTLAV